MSVFSGPEAVADLQIRLLGRFDLRFRDVPIQIPSRPAQSLLAYLVLNAGSTHRRERLAGLIWPDSAEEAARSNLRHALWRVRKAFDASGASGYVAADDLSVGFPDDARCFLDVAALQRPRTERDDANALREDVAAYGGELLPGFYDEWVILERERLRGIFERKMRTLTDRLAAEGRWAELAEWSERWISLAPTPEPGYRALMLARAALGDVSGVAAVYRRGVAALESDLGVAPSEQTRALYERLSRGERPRSLPPAPPASTLVSHEEPPAPGDPPYKGLRYFDASDAALFFGREALVARSVERVRERPFLAIIGASGSGKSSLVLAGVVPALASGPEGERWHPRALAPGRHPIESLAAAVLDTASVADVTTFAASLSRDPRQLRLHLTLERRRGGRALLVVDQLEELFTECADEVERSAFVDAIVSAAEPDCATVIVTLRADLYGEFARYASFRERLSADQEYMGPMSAAELRRAIEEPAVRGGWTFEPGLVELLLRDVGDEPGALPLLSHALLETWERRRGRTLTLRGYAEAGGVRGAVARTADLVFEHRIAPEQRAIARMIFLRLAAFGDRTEGTRRRVPIEELIPDPKATADVRATLEILAAARLITIGEGTVEVAHEALIREWPMLRGWLNEDQESLRTHRHLAASARDWEASDRGEQDLYRGARLAQAQEWSAAHPNDVSPLERSFLAASIELAQRERTEREARRQRELDDARRIAEVERRRAQEQGAAAAELRRRAVALGGAFILAIALAGVAVLLGEKAQQSAAVASANARVALARELAAASLSQLGADPERSILLALRAVDTTRSIEGTWTREAEDALHRAVQASRVERTLFGHTDAVIGVAYSGGGERVATASVDKTARVWDVATGRELVRLTGHTEEVNAAVFSPDGTRIATASDDHTAKLWDAATGREILTLRGHTDDVSSVAFSTDGTRIATASLDATVRLWDATSGELLRTLSGHRRGIRMLAYSPDDRRIATASLDGTARVWDAASGKEIATLDGHGGRNVFGVAFSPDGARVVTASGDTTVRLWDAASGKQLLVFTAHMGITQGVAFDRTGTRVVSGDYVGIAKVWDSATGREAVSLAGHVGAIFGAAFAPDGEHVATAGQDNTVRIWYVGPAREVMTLPVAASRVAYGSDGVHVAAAGNDGIAWVWDTSTGRTLTLRAHSDLIYGLALSPDGSRLATASHDGSAKVFDARTGELILTLSGHGPPLVTERYAGVLAVGYSPDGTRIATAGADGTAKIWDAVTGKDLVTLRGHTARLNGVAFSADGTLLATGSDDQTARVWNASTGASVMILKGHADRVWTVAFSPNGARLATASSDATVKLWDVKSGDLVATLSGHKATVVGLAFDRAGDRIITSGADRTARVWSVPDRTTLLTITDDTAVAYVAVNPDGSRLATATALGVRLYALRLDDLIEIAHTRLTRGWQESECVQFLHVDRCP